MEENNKATKENDNQESSNTEPINTAHLNDAPATNQAPHKSHRKLIITVIVMVFILVLAAVSAVFVILRNRDKAPSSSAATSFNKPKSQDPTPLNRFIHPTTGEKWYTTPNKLGDLGYYTEENYGANYYEVGTRDNNKVIFGSINMGNATPASYLFEKSPSGQISVIIHPNLNAKYTATTDAYITDNLKSDIKVDSTTHYDSLSPPSSFVLSGGETVSVPEYNFIGSLTNPPDATVTKTLVKQLGESKLMKVERGYVDTKLTAINYVIDTPIGTEYGLLYAPIPENLVEYTWNNSVNVPKTDQDYEGSISGIVRGCGSTAQSVSRSDGAVDNDFVVAGRTPDGQTVYAYKDNNSTVVQKAYKEYVDYFNGNYVQGSQNAPVVVSFDDFIKNHAVVAYKNVSGEWLVYTRDSLSPAGGCAKPVVYLYPQKAQNIRVGVGADVKISDPQYNSTTGWLAYARPDGSLTVNGKSYDSLFWEGIGYGKYPAITSGTVVKQGDVVSTMRRQLGEQGLNTKETNDFVNYWQTKIPQSSYVRLTWFNTTQMEELAPLYVAPKPDTVIRVFLDMSGYDHPINIPRQSLHSTHRSGFTVVEWGGLSQQKLF